MAVAQTGGVAAMGRQALTTSVALAAILAVQSRPARAQTAPPASGSTPQASVSEVIVTATRRSESVLKVPYNISALSGEDLSRTGIADLASIRNAVPGLQAADYGERASNINNNFIIRGVNTNDIGVGESEFPNLAGPTVSNYVDDTPLFINLKLTDIARVEVLRGPQGTLFGADSEGGTVRTLHNKPDTSHLDYFLDGTVSGTDRADQPNYNLDLMLNLPITDRLALRLNAGYERLAGFIDADNAVQYSQNDAFLPLTAQPVLADPADPLGSAATVKRLHDINKSHVWFTRGDALWKPTDRLSAELSYQHQENDASAFAYEYPGADYVTHRRLPITPSKTTTDIGALTLTADFGFGTVTSSSSYFNVGTRDLYDNSGIDVELPYYYGAYPRITTPNYDFNRDNGLTQEVRLVSPVGRRFDYIVGAYYQNRRDVADSVETVPGFAAYANLPGSATAEGFDTLADQLVDYYGGTRPGSLSPADLTYDFDRSVQFTDLAGFGEATLHLTPSWRVTGGVRVFEETFRQTTVQHIYNAGTSFGSDSLGTSAGMGAKHSQDQIFKANTSYDLGPHSLAYFTFSQGYRAGGANAYPVGTCVFCNDASFVTFGPDRTDNFEVGVKGRAGPLRYSADLYEITWEHIQLEVASTAGTPIIVNGGGARSRGAELELAYDLTRDARLSGGYAFTDAVLTDSFSLDGGVFTGADGTRLPGVSHHQLNAAIDYSPTVFATHKLDLHLDGSYRSGFDNQIEVDLPNFVRLTGYALFDAYAETEVAPHMTLQLFAHNLLNAKAVSAVSALSPGGPPGAYATAETFEPAEFVTRPLTVGLRFVVRR